MPESGHSLEEESRLIAQCKAGDRESFLHLVRPYLHSLQLLTYSILQNKEDVEEVVQESVMKAFAHLDQLRAGGSFKAWLMQIAVNEARCRHRRDRKYLFESIEEESEREESSFKPRQFEDWRHIPFEELNRKEMRVALTNALNSLEEGYRAVFLLRDVQHLSAAETGEILGISEAAVNTRLHRARLQMREQLNPLFRQPQRRWMSLNRFTVMAHIIMGRIISCRKVISEISRYIQGEIPSDLRKDIEHHLRICHRCTVLLDTLRKLLYIVGDDKVFATPFQFNERWHELVEEKLKAS